MKKTTRLLMCGVLVAGMLPQVTSAVTYTNKVKNIQARNVRVNLAAGTGVASGEVYNSTNGAIRNQYTVALGGATGKAWIQFDISSAWAQYGQANLANATLTLWNQNGISRRFWVAGIADGAGLEGWDQSTLTWSNAPANDYFNLASMGYGWDYSKCFGGTNIWDNLGTGGIWCTAVGNVQGCYYVSTNGTSKVTEFLQSDTDGKVTCSISDGPANSNQTIPIGTNGVYDGQLLAAEGTGVPTRDSPTLTLVFDVRVALVGGGQYCGGAGLDVSLAGSDVGVDYLLYKDSVYTGQTVAGTGSAVSFGLKTEVGTYTAVASNTTTTVTSPVLGDSVVIFAPTPPSIAVQPASFVAATNSIAFFTLVGLGDISSYAWYRDGVALTDDGHYSGTDTAQLIVNPVLASDAATTANGYYCVLSDVCGGQATSTTNALTIQVARDLVWQGTPANTWDIGTTANWLNGASASVFNQGDNVILNDTALDTTVAPASRYLSPGNITFNHSSQMTINGSERISGPNSKLIVNGTTASSRLSVNSANDLGGGAVINDGWLYLGVFNAIGVETNTTITMAGTGFSLLEIGTATAINGVINVLENSTLSLPLAGSTYFTFNGSLVGTAGKILTIQAPAALAGQNARFYGNFTCDLDIVLALNGANLAPYQGGTTIHNGVISGNGILYPRGGTTILNGANTFLYTLISQGHVGVGIDSDLYGASPYSPLGLGTFTQDNQGDNGILAWGGARTVENPFTWLYRDNANRSFTTLGTNQLTMSGAFDLSGGTNNVIRTFNIGNTAPTILSGVISDAGQNMGINKTGNGLLLLNGGNTYTGPTTVSAGALGGTGSIAGPVTVPATGTLAPGASIGTLTINNSLTVSNSTLAIEVNKSASPANDAVLVSGTLSALGTGGRVTVTNLGPALNTGDRFVLFNKAMSGGSVLTVTGSDMIWTNKLAVDGSIEVIAPIATTPAEITSTVSGTTLTLSWPASHIGWTLQRQINPLNVGLSTNWTTVPGYETVNSATIAINPASPAVFYRLFYLAPQPLALGSRLPTVWREVGSTVHREGAGNGTLAFVRKIRHG